jgi:hypothetical protein
MGGVISYLSDIQPAAEVDELSPNHRPYSYPYLKVMMVVIVMMIVMMVVIVMMMVMMIVIIVMMIVMIVVTWSDQVTRMTVVLQ